MRTHSVAPMLVILTAALFGCGGEEVVEPRPAIQVRLLDAGAADAIWRRQAEDVLDHLRSEFGAAATTISVQGSHGRRTALEKCGNEDVDLVVCVGTSFETEVLTVAQNYPRTAFLLSPGSVTDANVATLDFQPFGAAYLGGVIAATGGDRRVGIVTGDGGPWLEVIAAGFAEGFLSVFPSGGILRGTGPDDIHRMADESVEVALYAADRADEAVVEAARRAGIELVGVGRTALSDYPETVVAALSVDLPEAIDRIMRDVLDGTFRGRTYTYDLGSGVVDMIVSTDLQRRWDDDDLERVNEARAAVNAGLVELERMGF